METALVSAIVVAAVFLVVLFRSLVLVPPGQAYVIERLGRFDRVLQQGLHVLLPFVHRVAARVPLGEELAEVPAASDRPQSASETSVSGLVTFRVSDAARAVSQVADYRAALISLVRSEWQQAVAASDEITVVDHVRATDARIRAAAEGWGLAIIEIQPAIRLAPEAMRALEAQADKDLDARVAAWAVERRQRPGPDGRPTEDQRAAYREWLDLELRIHADDLAEAQRLENP
jgi:hypothetical protein